MYEFPNVENTLRICVDLTKVDAIQECFPAYEDVFSYKFCVGPLEFEILWLFIKESGFPSYEQFIKMVKDAKNGNS